MSLAAARAAARLLAERMPYLPDQAVIDLIEHPRAAAPDEITYMHITQLPPGIVHSLWMRTYDGRVAA